ncbi:CTP synthase ura7 [Lecanora helva]
MNFELRPLTEDARMEGVLDKDRRIDAGTMAPREHGEVFVLDDGGETDLDLGNYERYLNVTLTRENNVTTGKMYLTVIERERAGLYLGKTVQMVPHLTDAIIEHIERVSRVPVDDTNEEPDVCIIELGGTIGDLESAVFVEALRQLRRRVGRDNFLQIHVSLIPVINEELKTKPTQAAIKEVRSLGLAPDLIACRCSKALDKGTINKIALYCDVEPSQVVAVTDVTSLYHVPIRLESQGLIKSVSDVLRLERLTLSPGLERRGARTWNAWKDLAISQDHLHESVSIALVGKYCDHPDSYHSVVKSLEHASMACSRKLLLLMVDAEHLEQSTLDSSPKEYHKAWHEVYKADGILIPGGFGTRGCEGMISAIRTCREQKTPFLGICLGLQLATIEFARNECDLPQATSAEFNAEAPVPLIIHMPEIDRKTMGATMRLGNRPTIFQPGSEWSRIYKLYRHDRNPSLPTMNGSEHAGTGSNSTNSTTSDINVQDISTTNSTTQNGPQSSTEPSPLTIHERHRHRYEVNPEYVDTLEKAGLNFIGRDESGQRMEILELKDHPYFVAVQFHPEYLSKVLKPSKPFLGFVAASAGVLDEVISGKKRRRTGSSTGYEDRGLVDAMGDARIQ